MIKSIASLREPDERFKNMAGGFSGSGIPRPMELEDMHGLVVHFELGPTVPDEIRQQYDTARHAFIYSWYAYDMVTLAENHCYGMVERALELKAGKEGEAIRRGLKNRLDDAVKHGWLNEADFEMPAGTGTSISQLEMLRRLRNNLAHGKTHLFPTGTLGIMQLCGVIVTKLFAGDTADAAPR